MLYIKTLPKNLGMMLGKPKLSWSWDLQGISRIRRIIFTTILKLNKNVVLLQNGVSEFSDSEHSEAGVFNAFFDSVFTNKVSQASVTSWRIQGEGEQPEEDEDQVRGYMRQLDLYNSLKPKRVHQRTLSCQNSLWGRFLPSFKGVGY